MNWRFNTERRFESFSDLVFNNSKKVIFTVLLIVGTLVTQLPSLKMDTSTEGFLHKTDPMRIDYDVFRNEFGRDEKLMVAVKTENIFNLNFLQKLDSFHRTLEDELPYIEGVDSLINARNTYGVEGELIVEPLIETLR